MFYPFLLRSQRKEKKKASKTAVKVKYSAQKLTKKGVLLEIERVPENHYVLTTTWRDFDLINMS